MSTTCKEKEFIWKFESGEQVERVHLLVQARCSSRQGKGWAILDIKDPWISWPAPYWCYGEGVHAELGGQLLQVAVPRECRQALCARADPWRPNMSCMVHPWAPACHKPCILILALVSCHRLQTCSPCLETWQGSLHVG